VLIAAIKTTHPSAEDYHRDVEQAETSVRAAQVAIQAIGRPVKVETEIQRGWPADILVSESAHAEMVCVGSVGIDRYTRALIGSTATEVAERSHCPVAVIRWRPDHPRQDIDRVVADAGQLAQIVGAHSHSAFRRAEASVLIVSRELKRKRPGFKIVTEQNENVEGDDPRRGIVAFAAFTLLFR
jgi:Universal stress protein family